MKVIAIIQARLGSTRLPQKILLPIAGKTMLARVVEQVERIQGLDSIIVAVPSDDRASIRPIGRAMIVGVPGDSHDVLRRYWVVAQHFEPDVIMRITSDCPLLDAEYASTMLQHYTRIDRGEAYYSNTYPTRLVPDGCDVEIFSRSLLERVYHESRRGKPVYLAAREHVTPLMQAWASSQAGLPVYDGSLRWTVDTEEDLEFVREVSRGLHGAPVTIENILRVTPPDVCELCYQGVPHLWRMLGPASDTKTMNYALHQIDVWNGRVFEACEAFAMAPWGGTRRRG